MAGAQAQRRGGADGLLRDALTIGREYPVFPVRLKGGKRPALSNARAGEALGETVPKGRGGYHLASSDPERIEALFRAAMRDGGDDLSIGVSLEAAGLIAVDLDLYKGGKAREWIETHQNLFAEDRIHQTASGGLHILLRPPEGVTFPGKVPGLSDAEIKHKGYIVWPEPTNSYEVLQNVEVQGMTPEQIELLSGAQGGASGKAASAEFDDNPDVVFEKRILDGEDFHDSFLVLTRRWASHSWREQEILDRCASLLKTAVRMIEDPQRKERAQQLLDELLQGQEGEIARLVSGAIRRESGAGDLSDIAGAIFDGPPVLTLPEAKSRETASEGVSQLVDDDEDLQLPRSECDIPARHWLLGSHYVRGYVSMTAAPGGVGKSTLSMVDALSMALGRGLLGQRVVKPLRVLYWCGEDPKDEIERRMIAAMKYYGVTNEDLRASPGRLYFKSGREYPLKIATLEEFGQFVVGEASVNALTDACQRLSLDCIIIDPFSSAHRISENNNEQMAGVLEQLRNLAEACDVSVELVHHTTKEARDHSRQYGIAVARGASAIVDAARSARLLAPMTKEQAKDYAIPAEQRRAHVEIESGKANMAGGNGSQWLKLVTVNLDNPEELYPQGDEVGVAAPWEPPATMGEDFVSLHEAAAVRWLLDTQPAPEDMRQDPRSGQWVGYTLAQGLGLDAGPGIALHALDEEQKRNRAGVESLVETLIEWGALEKTAVLDAQYRSRPAYKVRVDRAKQYLEGLGDGS